MRWNHPPNWPAPPPGWTPPVGWQPDPAWGPPPPGHTFWVPEPPASPTSPLNQPTARFPVGTPHPGAPAPAGGQGGRSDRSSMWIAVALVTLLVVVLSGVAVLVLQGGDEDADTPASSRTEEDPVDEPTEANPGPTEQTEPTEGPAGGVLQLGESATVGDWVVSIDAVEQDANQLIADTNEYNEPPSGQYVLVDLTATYQGAGTSDAWLNVQPKFVEPDGTENPAYECIAALPEPAFNTPSLRKGESASYQVCFDVPAANIEGGTIVIVDLADFGGDGVAWTAE